MNKNYTVYYVPEWFSLHIHLILTMRIIMSFPFYRSENWNIKLLNNLPKATNSYCGGYNIRIHVHVTPKSKFLIAALFWLPWNLLKNIIFAASPKLQKHTHTKRRRRRRKKGRDRRRDRRERKKHHGNTWNPEF